MIIIGKKFIMKKIFLPLCFCLSAATSIAQEIHRPALADIVIGKEIPRAALTDNVIGWMKVYNFEDTKGPLKVGDKLYSVAHQSIAGSLANWIQASYIPKGGLGDVTKNFSAELFFDKNYSAALPPNYGVYSSTYYFLKYNSSRKLIPATGHNLHWTIMANVVPPYFIRGLSTNKQPYFTIPGIRDELLKDQRSLEYKYIERYGLLSNHPVIGKYISMLVPPANGYMGLHVVILAKDNKLPFIHLTMGEVLQIAEEVIPEHWEIEKKIIFEKTQGKQRDIELYTKLEMDKIERAKITLVKLKERYKTRLNEPAYLHKGQFVLMDLANREDIFSGGRMEDPALPVKKINPVYKVDPAAQALSKPDKPEWIYMHWPWFSNWGNPRLTYDPTDKHMHESIINNFNFDYVYNFFFDPEKVKGQPYKPLALAASAGTMGALLAPASPPAAPTPPPDSMISAAPAAATAPATAPPSTPAPAPAPAPAAADAIKNATDAVLKLRGLFGR